MKGGDQMQTLLNSTAAVTSLLASWVKSSVTTYAIFDQTTIPDSIDTDTDPLELSVEAKTVNHFPNSNLNGGDDYGDLTRQISCRAYTEIEAVAIQTACFDALNRKISIDKKVFFVVASLPPIPGQDSVDNFNAPLIVRTIIR